MLFEKIKLEADEKVLKVVHKHWFEICMRTFSIFITAIIPLVAWVVLSALLLSEQSPLEINLSSYLGYFSFFYSAWLLFNWMTLAHMVTDYHLDVWVVTDRRIISIDQQGLFRRHVGSFRLEKLQDVNIEINGIVATFLSYGTVEAQTASGSEEEFRSDHLPHPRELKALILQAADERMNRQSNNQHQSA